MKKAPPYADSTVGMTAYNVIAMHKQPLEADTIHVVATRLQLALLDKAQLGRCLRKLVKLKRIRRNDDDTFELIAQEHLFVVQRDMGDYDEMTMEGGWDAWRVKDPRIKDGIGTRQLESLIGQPLTDRVPRPLRRAV